MRFKVLLLVPLLAATLACPPSQPIETNARDVSASLSGVLVTAQSQHQECVQDSTPQTCQVIKRGVSGENALITALETYCGMQISPTLDTSTPCSPVKDALGALQTAISNAQQLTTEVKGTVTP